MPGLIDADRRPGLESVQGIDGKDAMALRLAVAKAAMKGGGRVLITGISEDAAASEVLALAGSVETEQSLAEGLHAIGYEREGSQKFVRSK